MLDEVTVDLDVVARMDLLEFFKEECEQVYYTTLSYIYNVNSVIFWLLDLCGYGLLVLHTCAPF